MKETGRWEVIAHRRDGENYLHSVEDSLEDAIDKLRKLFTDPKEKEDVRRVWIEREKK